MAPMSQAYVEENGDDYLTRNPMGVGPYKMSEWVTGDYILLEKNPDFNWGPETWENTGPWNIDYIKFRVIPEEATIIAGLESGELNYSGIEAKDLTYFEELDFTILERTRTETDPEARQEAVIEAQSYIAQQAYFVPMYAPINFSVVSPSVKNIRFSPLTGLMLDNAVIEK